jgi:Uma2 family endonuclease
MSQTNLAYTDKLFTVEEYLVLERQADEKHEYVNGQIIAMAGASRRHNLICGSIGTELRFQLKGKNCETYFSDMRVRMKNNRYGYPDVVVVCGEPQFADDEFDTLLNPTLVVEVLSKSTRFRDKTEKLETYQKMESVRECLLIEQDKMRVELYRKQTPTQWLIQIAESPEEIIILDSINCKLSLADIYAQITFDSASDKID